MNDETSPAFRGVLSAEDLRALRGPDPYAPADGVARETYTGAEFAAFALLFATHAADPRAHNARLELIARCRTGGSWERSGRRMLYALRQAEARWLTADKLRTLAATRWGSVEAAACSFLRVGYWWLDGVFLAETCRAHIARRYGMTPEQFGPVAALFADAYVDELVAEVRRAYGLPTNGN